MQPSKRVNWRKGGGQQFSSPSRGLGHGQIYANCSFSETSASRSNVNYASPTISSLLKKTGQMPEKAKQNTKDTPKQLFARKLKAAEQSLEKSPSEDKEEEASQVIGEVIYLSPQATGSSDCQHNVAKFADALSLIVEEKENDDEDFSHSTGSISPPHQEAEEKAITSEEDDEKSSYGGEQVDGNLKEHSEVDAASIDEGTEEKNDAKDEAVSSDDALHTPKVKMQELRQQNKPSKEERIKELQEKLSQLEAKLKELQETKNKKEEEEEEVFNGKTLLEDSFSSLPPLTPEQLRIIASDKCSSGAPSPPESSSSGGLKATLVLDGIYHLPLPRDFNRLPSVQRDFILVALPGAIRESYLNMCWEARFFDQMTVAPMKAARQELLLSLKL